jgi:putative ABC transport system ATP-binding protein
MQLLNVSNLSKTYGTGPIRVEALKNASFTMRKSEFAAIVGESGSGKTTLLNLIGALDTPTSGHIYLNDQELFSMPEQERTIFRRRNIGFIFQSFQLIPELTVEQNIIFPLLLDYQKPDPEKVNELLEVLRLTERRSHLPSQLSGGQQQRTAIGRALIHSPMLILADEPTGNLDSKSSQEVMELLTHAAHHYRQTVLMITHNLGLTAYADRVLRVSDGNLTDLGGNHDEKLS